MEVVITTGAIRRQNVSQSSQSVATNKPLPSFFTCRLPFLSPNQQCQSTEGKVSAKHHSLYYGYLFLVKAETVWYLLMKTECEVKLDGTEVRMSVFRIISEFMTKEEKKNADITELLGLVINY